MANTILPFLFEKMPIRGKLLRIGGLAEHIPTLETHANLGQAVAELVASSALMASELKNPELETDPSVILQVQGEGAVKALMARCSWRGNLKAYVNAEPTATFETLAASHPVFAITVDYGQKTTPYQSFVPVEEQGIAASLEGYFNQSVQLKTLWKTFALPNSSAIGALFLQALPHKNQQEFADDWRRLEFIAASLNPLEIASEQTDLTALASLLFAEDDVRTFAPQALTFQQPNTRPRMAEALKNLGQQACEEMLADGPICMTCETSGKTEIFTEDDIRTLFSA